MKPDKKILVTGAGGFIGKVVVAHLLVHGWQVTAMVRKAARLPFIRNKELEILYADMRDASSLKNAMKDVCVVVHLAANMSDGNNSDDENVGGARRLILACKEEGCKRIINISTQSVKIKRKGTYARTKREAEKILHGSGLQVTSLRPSIVYGEELLGVFGTVLNFVKKLPFVPVLGDGKWICAPIYIGDVSEAIISCLENDRTIGKIYDLGGPDQISFDNFIDRICLELDIKRIKIHIPFGFSMIVARVLAKIMARPPITISNVLGSNQNTDIDIIPAQKDFGFNPLCFDKGLKAVLEIILKPEKPEAPGKINIYKPDDDQGLKDESNLITNYLLGSNLPKQISDRYVAANRKLVKNRNLDYTYPELGFVLRHHWALPFIDAGAGWLSPNSVVRKKIFLMVAILETSPEYAGYFLQKPNSILKLLSFCVWNGFRSVFKLIIGIPIFVIARRGFNEKSE